MPRTRRRRTSAEVVGVSPRRRLRNRENHNVDEGCIDLTTTADESFVDLTTTRDSVSDISGVISVHDEENDSPLHGANDQSVVVIETPEARPPSHRLRQLRVQLETMDDLDLPHTPFKVNDPGRASTVISSPDPIKVQCPICLDDDKTIKRTKRKLYSTKCGHVFCDECIKSSVSIQRVCPVCRTKLRLSDLHPLHI